MDLGRAVSDAEACPSGREDEPEAIVAPSSHGRSDLVDVVWHDAGRRGLIVAVLSENLS